MLQRLLTEGEDAAVLELVSKLVSRNAELELQLARLLRRTRKNEGVSAAQLQLFVKAMTVELDAAPESPAAGLQKLDEKLRDASGIDDEKAAKDDEEAKKRKRQPRSVARSRRTFGPSTT